MTVSRHGLYSIFLDVPKARIKSVLAAPIRLGVEDEEEGEEQKQEEDEPLPLQQMQQAEQGEGGTDYDVEQGKKNKEEEEEDGGNMLDFALDEEGGEGRQGHGTHCLHTH